jgi:hypothetical protein
MFSNIRILFSSLSRIIAYTILVLIAAGIWYYFTDVSVMFGNYGPLHTYTDMSLSGVMILGFPLFILAIVYK